MPSVWANISSSTIDTLLSAKEHQPMNHTFLAFAFQETDADSSMWIIIIAVVVILFFIVFVIVVGLVIFFIMRKRSKAKAAAAAPYMTGVAPAESLSPYAEAQAVPEVAAALDAPPVLEPPPPIEEMRADVAEAAPATGPEPASPSGSMDFDPSRTVAINRENTVAI